MGQGKPPKEVTFEQRPERGQLKISGRMAHEWKQGEQRCLNRNVFGIFKDQQDLPRESKPGQEWWGIKSQR